MINAYDDATRDKVVEHGTEVAGTTTDIKDALARAKEVEQVFDCVGVL
jgi:hypothetical protein